MTLRLLLVRHGLSSFNLEGRIQGRNDLSTLTDEGRQQSIETGKFLSELPIDAIYSSPLQRAAKTTENLIEELRYKPETIFDEGLLEINLGSWSGMTVNDVKDNFPEIYQLWKTRPEEIVLDDKNGHKFKPFIELASQVREFLMRLIKLHPLDKDKTILIVAHNAILRCLILELLGQQKQGFRRLQLDNTSISVINLKPSLIRPYQVQLECLNNTTHLGSTVSKKNHGARLLLVRHGETNWNRESRFQGQIDIPLNNNGRTQAKAAKSFLTNFKINRAFSSSMSRSRQTAESILECHPDIDLELKEGLIEIGHGLWEGKLESEIKAEWPDLLKTWQIEPEKVQMPEGESICEVWSRSIKCWEEICSNLNPKETALVVAHDAVNKTILCHLLGLSPADIWMVKQGNGCVNVIDISTDSNQPDVLTSLNLTSHQGGLLDRTAEGAL